MQNIKWLFFDIGSSSTNLYDKYADIMHVIRHKINGIYGFTTYKNPAIAEVIASK